MTHLRHPRISLLPRSASLALGLTLSAGLLAACPGGGAPVCTEEARTSLSVSVTDESGDPIEQTLVRYSVDGGDFMDCEESGAGWTCGWETAGNFEVQITADGFAAQIRNLTIGEDECHVISQSVDIMLEAIPCTDEVVPSILLTLVDEAGDPLTAATGSWAQWGVTDEDGPLSGCEIFDADRLVCGWEQAGSIDLTAGRIDHYGVAQTVVVEADDCHVITEEVELPLPNSTLPCDDELVPSVTLSVTDESGQPVTGANVQYSPIYLGPSAQSTCTDSGDGNFICAFETAGPLNIKVGADGYDPWDTTVFVTTDACHVITQDVVASLTPAAE